MATREVSFNLAGSVRNQSLPVAGTTIILYDYWTTGSGLVRHYLSEQVTGPRGEFSFDVRKGVYSLEVVPNRDTRFARQSIDTIKVSHNTTFTINLQSGCLFSGVVRTKSGDIVPDCELLFFGIEPEPLRAYERTGKEGQFSISLPRGKYYVACRQMEPTAKTKRTARGLLCTTMSLLEVERDLVGSDLVLAPLVPFKGAVTNAEGHPVADVKATIRRSQPDENPFSQEAGLVGIAYTNKIGQFECLVEPGLYDVKLEPGPESHLSERQVNAILVDQARLRTYSLSSGHQLAGTVTFAGEPIKNALVTVHGGKTHSSVLTDDDGSYAFALSGGSYNLTITAQPDSLAQLPLKSPAPFATVVKLSEDTLKDVELLPGVCVAGRVTDHAEHARPGVQLSLYQDTGKPVDTTAGEARPLLFAITGDDGSYEFRVAAGKYCIVVNNQQSTCEMVEVEEDDIQKDIVWQSGCLVDFEVISEFDEAVPNCQVVCEQYQGVGEPVQEISNENGICHFNLAAGIYSFRFEPPAHGSYEPKAIRQLSINSDIRRKVKLAPKAVTVQPSG